MNASTEDDCLLKLDQALEAARLAGLPTPYASLFERGEISVWLWVPSGTDPQSPHDRDEIYVVPSGSGVFRRDQKTVDFAAGDCLFVPAGVEHRFERFSADFSTWVFFFGPRQRLES